MAKLAAKTYGDALYELALEEGKANEFLKEFSFIYQALKLNPDFLSLMNHPKVLTEEKTKMLDNVFKSRISLEMSGFLRQLVIKGRFNEMEAIYNYFSGRIKDLLGIGTAFVSTAYSLNEIQKAGITERLILLTDYQKMEVDFSVDEKLIGGMVIRIGDRVVDGSIAMQLNNLKKQLLKA